MFLSTSSAYSGARWLNRLQSVKEKDYTYVRRCKSRRILRQRGEPGVHDANRRQHRARLSRVAVRSERGVWGYWSACLQRSSCCGTDLPRREPGRFGRHFGSGGGEYVAAPVVRHGTARAGAAPWWHRGGLVAIRGSSRSDALGVIRPRHCHAHRGRARRGWTGRADPRLRADVAAPCRGLRARTARARGDLHRRGVGHPRQRFDATVAAAARRGWRQLAHPGRDWKPRHCGWVATGVRRRSGLSCVARLARCHWPTAHPFSTLFKIRTKMRTQTAELTALEDRQVPVQAKLAAAWTSFMFFYIYVDYFGLETV